MLTSLSQEGWENVAWIGFWLVIAGVALEIVGFVAKLRKEHSHESILAKDPWYVLPAEGLSIVIVVLGLCVELIGEYHASKLVRQKSDQLTVELENTMKSEQTNSLAVALLNASASSNNLEIAQIEEKIASEDPTNAPLYIVTGDLRIQVLDTIGDRNLNCSFRLTISSSSRKIVLLAVTAYPIRHLGAGNIYSVPFSTALRSLNNPFVAAPLDPNLTALEASKTFDQCSLEISGFPVTNGAAQKISARINFNQYWKRYLLNDIQFTNGVGTATNM